jgi:hypothetical protein
MKRALVWNLDLSLGSASCKCSACGWSIVGRASERQTAPSSLAVYLFDSHKCEDFPAYEINKDL